MTLDVPRVPRVSLSDTYMLFRYGRIVGMDWYNRSTTPWYVEIQYTDMNIPAVEELRKELRLEPQGPGGAYFGGNWATWAGTADDGNVGSPMIVGFPPRFNFDSFRFSLFTAFQLITCEGWNDNLYDIVGSTDVWNGLYLIALIICGNWCSSSAHHLMTLSLSLARARSLSHTRNTLMNMTSG